MGAQSRWAERHRVLSQQEQLNAGGPNRPVVKRIERKTMHCREETPHETCCQGFPKPDSVENSGTQSLHQATHLVHQI